MLGVTLAVAPAFVLAQADCNTVGTLTFRNEAGGTVTLNDATVRNVTGSNNDDRDISLNALNNPQVRSSGGGLQVDSGLAPSDFTDTGVRANGFNRSIGRFWELNFDRGDCRFNRRSDLDVAVTLSVEDGEATNGSSFVAVEPELRRLRTNWYGGSNDLRRLRGDVRFSYNDLSGLSVAGTHTTRFRVRVEISGNI